ncbi:helix-turn-helix transcriptional regulator [Desulfobotulus mexicanus]|uniref:WYL domain-containing protein n=1 Tax=Desulfobotulus mexicanus TaxID=2586642 RepID=A0A5Q4VC32_9BACT|nr:WYL domain-containing protein [Desulfobotulus mexicanus]TYT75105.1 WYL domain-containing protein [Desulfobotulus mexicanus]
MNQLERIYRIDALLQTGKCIPLSRMEEEMEKSRSSIKRDIQYMRDYFDAPIIYNKQNHCYRYDADAGSFELPGFWLSQTELYALRLLQEVTDTEEKAAMAPFLVPVREKLDKALAKLGHDPGLIARCIQVMPVYQRQLERPVFSAVCKALLQAQVLDIRYHGRGEDKIENRRIHPQKLIQYQINWYLVAHCELRKELRTFSMDRISVMALPGLPAELIDPKKIKEHTESGFGIFAGKAENTAFLRFYQPNARWVKDEKWHKNQMTRWDGDTLILSLPYNSSTELVREILRHGPGVKVESPESLKKEVVEALQKSLGNYEV